MTFNADIDRRDRKITIAYTDRRTKPGTPLNIELDRNKITIETRVGAQTKQQITLHNKGVAEIKTALTLIGIPATQEDLELLILGLLWVRHSSGKTEKIVANPEGVPEPRLDTSAGPPRR